MSNVNIIDILKSNIYASMSYYELYFRMGKEKFYSRVEFIVGLLLTTCQKLPELVPGLVILKSIQRPNGAGAAQRA